MTFDSFAEAEQLSKNRARFLPVLAVMFIMQQTSFFAMATPLRNPRMVDVLHIGGWLIMALTMLAALWNGGYWFKPAEVRALMNDEVTRDNRAKALSLGFLLAMLMAIGLYVLRLFVALDAPTALHLITSVGLGSALIRFGLLERRALRD